MADPKLGRSWDGKAPRLSHSKPDPFLMRLGEPARPAFYGFLRYVFTCLVADVIIYIQKASRDTYGLQSFLIEEYYLRKNISNNLAAFRSSGHFFRWIYHILIIRLTKDDNRRALKIWTLKQVHTLLPIAQFLKMWKYAKDILNLNG